MKTKKEKSNTWFSNDNRVLWRLPKDVFSSPMKPVTVGYVKKNVKSALKFICKIAGGQPATLPKFSPIALKDYDVVLMLLEIIHSVSLMGKRFEQALEYLTEEERAIGTRLARAVIERVQSDKLIALQNAIFGFQLWLEWLTDASVQIKLGIKRGAA